MQSSSGVSCAVCCLSLALALCSCTDGGASGTETDAAERDVLFVRSNLTGFKQVQPKLHAHVGLPVFSVLLGQSEATGPVGWTGNQDQAVICQNPTTQSHSSETYTQSELSQYTKKIGFD